MTDPRTLAAEEELGIDLAKSLIHRAQFVETMFPEDQFAGDMAVVFATEHLIDHLLFEYGYEGGKLIEYIANKITPDKDDT